MPQRKYNKTKIVSKKRTKRITLPTSLSAYNELSAHTKLFRQHLDEMLKEYPELFPADISQGYKLHGMMPASTKMPDVQLRRMQLKALDEQERLQVFTVAPCDILPYMTGDVTELEKVLFYWRSLFTAIIFIPCFLHAFINIRSRGKRLGNAFSDIQQQVWDIYHTNSRVDFLAGVKSLQCWTKMNADSLTDVVIKAIDKLCVNADSFVLTFEYPDAYRTSNMVDRHMEPMSRWLYGARYFHGHLLSAELQTRSWTLLHNFWPYCPRAQVSKDYQSPAHKLNGFTYRNNWLENLLVSTSIQGFHVSNKK
jgi:hypothetical protein